MLLMVEILISEEQDFVVQPGLPELGDDFVIELTEIDPIDLRSDRAGDRLNSYPIEVSDRSGFDTHGDTPLHVHTILFDQRVGVRSAHTWSVAYKGRRRFDRVLLTVGGLALAGVAAAATAIGDGERITRYRTSAELGPSGEAAVIEVIDYDFGVSDRHGIFRDVPGLGGGAPIEVESATAPDQFIVEYIGFGSRIRIGDPDATIDGRHRYSISYPIGVVGEDGLISWNAVGDQWPVSIGDVEVELLAANELINLRCSQGSSGTWDGCTVTQPEPGRLVVTADKLSEGEGITVSAARGPALGAAPASTIELADGGPFDPGSGIGLPALAAGALALVAAAGGSALVRRNGKEMVWAGGSADAAFGPQYGEDFAVRRVDHDELDALASTEFAPPKELSAWQGGILHREQVDSDHQSAWLLERAIAGEIEIEGTGDDLVLHLNPVDSPEHRILDTMFAGRSKVALGTYDKQFASGWDVLTSSLNRWYDDSPYWDAEGERRRRRVLGWGFVPLIMGVIVAIVFSVLAGRMGAAWIAGVAVGGAIFGVGLAMITRSWELRVRTPQGSGLWILVESFRRFIEKSDAQHVEAAAEQGLLRDYTAWAVALGEAQRWADAIEEARVEHPERYSNDVVHFAAIAPHLGGAVSSTNTAPQSSSSGGGGSVGGGGGGGGGGSW